MVEDVFIEEEWEAELSTNADVVELVVIFGVFNEQVVDVLLYCSIEEEFEGVFLVCV